MKPMTTANFFYEREREAILQYAEYSYIEVRPYQDKQPYKVGSAS